MVYACETLLPCANYILLANNVKQLSKKPAYINTWP